MTVAVPDRTAPPPPWRPPSDPHPLTASNQPLCYHGNFSLSFVDDGNDATDDEVDTDDLRSILELAGNDNDNKKNYTHKLVGQNRGKRDLFSTRRLYVARFIIHSH